MSTRVLVPSGVLGLGFDADALQRGVLCKPDVICIDGGSTDSGPHYLGTGTSKYSYLACKSEWRQLMQARAELDVPLVITSCGTCGSDSMVDMMYRMTCEIAEELAQQVRVARLYSEQQPADLVDLFNKNRVSALEPAVPLDQELIDSATHIVALGGVEQIQEALGHGADIILAGRCTDTASIAAVPIMRGEHVGAAWHAAKIAECGALCSTNPTSGVILADIDEEGFTMVPLAEGAACTPHSVSAHMLYENSDPLNLYEPGGMLDVSKASYQQSEYPGLQQPAVRVTGSRWQPAGAYTVKLEGARHVGFQVTQLVVLRDQHYVENAQQWVDRLDGFLHQQIAERMGLARSDYLLDFRLIGVNSVLNQLENKTAVPVEVGVLLVITANDQDTTSELAKLANPFLLHYPLTDNEELPTFAFPYSPAESQRGELYGFFLNHILTLDQPMDAFRLQLSEVR